MGEPEPELHAGVQLGRHTLEVILELLLGHDGGGGGYDDCGSDVRDVLVSPATSLLQGISMYSCTVMILEVYIQVQIQVCRMYDCPIECDKALKDF